MFLIRRKLQYYTHRVATYPVISFSVGRASPKSKIFSSQSSFTAMLDGLRSCQIEKWEEFDSSIRFFQLKTNRKFERTLWMIPALWIYLRPLRIWYTKNCTWSSDRRCVRIILFKSAPIKCVHKYTCWKESSDIPAGLKTSSRPITFSWFMCFNNRISRYVRFAWTADWNGLANFFIATLMLLTVSTAELQRILFIEMWIWREYDWDMLLYNSVRALSS